MHEKSQSLIHSLDIQSLRDDSISELLCIFVYLNILTFVLLYTLYMFTGHSTIIINSSHCNSSASNLKSINNSLANGDEGNSEIMTTFLMLNAMIGSGILNQPQVFQISGIGGALILFTIAAYFIWLSLIVLIECGISRGMYDYSELAKHLLGGRGETLVDVAIVLGNFGALISYLDVIGEI